MFGCAWEEVGESPALCEAGSGAGVGNRAERGVAVEEEVFQRQV